MGGGLGSLGDLIGTGLNAAGMPGAADAVINTVGATPLGTAPSLATQALSAASPFINQAIAGMPAPTPTAPSRTVTPTTPAPVGSTAPGGPSGLTLQGNTSPQVGPWLSNFWNPTGMNTPGGGMTGSTGNVGNVPSAAPATSSLPSATNQQQLTSP